LSEGGDVPGASAAVRLGGVGTNTQPATKLLVETLRFRQGERAEPPVEEYLHVQMARRLIPSVSVAVVRNGQPLRLFSLGRINLEHDIPATTNSVYKLASITKTFVATGIMMLMEEGKLTLDDPISRYVTNAPAAWGKITVRHCLTHTTGLPNLWESPRWESRREYQPGELIGLIADQPLRLAPGESQEYNKGAFLLGYVIEAITGKPFGEFLRARIFEPLGMQATRLNDLDEVIPGRATGYAWNPAQNRVRNVIDWSRSLSALADGGVVSSIADLARWESALSEGKLLRPGSFEQMWTPATLSKGGRTEYGLGWQVSQYRGRPFVGHFAGGAGFSAMIMRFREEKLTVIVLCNSDASDAPRMAEAIAWYYLDPKGVAKP
jgi:CubicO group peptidase (beta-lactamase class C family)